MALAFPEITLTPNEDLGGAFQRVETAFKAAGIDIEDLGESPELQGFLHSFLATVDNDPHVFMLCTGELTEDREIDLLGVASGLCRAAETGPILTLS